MTRRGASLGLDLGGTWLRGCALEPGRRRPRKFKAPAVPAAELPRWLRARRWTGLERLVVGAAGVWAPKSRAALTLALRPLARKILVLSDLELAHRAAFLDGPGVLVIGGTGSVSLARDARGKTRREGGWGALLGDEGSAFWIGRRALHSSRLRRRLGLDPLALAHGSAPARALAAQARRVAALAARDPEARRIILDAARELADLARRSAAGLSWRGPAPLSWRGGLFQDERLRRAFLRRTGARFVPAAPALDPEVAAASLSW